MTFSIGITFLFFIYLIVWILIPGLLFEHLLLPRRLKMPTRILSGFFIGFIFMATVYFIQSLLQLAGLVTVIGPVITVIAIMLYFKHGRPSVYNADEKFSWNGVIIFGFNYIVSVLNFQLKYIGAIGNETTQVYHDYLFHTGNIVSLSRSFPNYDIRVEGLKFYYHYFYELIFAMCKHIFGMDAFRLYLNGNAIICALPFTLALLILGERIRGGKVATPARRFFYAAGTLVSCVCIMPLNVVGVKLPFSWANNHFFGNANALGLAFAITVLTIDVLTEVWYEKYNTKFLIALYLFAAAATGFKGTTGILLVGITWSVFIVELLITKRFHIARLFYAIGMSLGFGITYFLITVGPNSSGSNNRATALTPEGTIMNGRVGQVLTKLGIDPLSFPVIIIAIVLCAICIIGPCVLAFTGFTVKKLSVLVKEKTIGDIFDWFAIGIVLMGLIGSLMFTVPGNSQIYFVVANTGIIFYCAMKYVLDNPKGIVTYLTYFFFGVGTLFLAVDIAYFCYDDIRQNAVYHSEAGKRPDLVSKDTMDAYLWLRDNTPEDSLVAVDRISEETDYRDIFFYCSAFSERQCYLEGYDYSDISEKQIEAMMSMNEKFYSPNSAEARPAMDMVGVDYLMVTTIGHHDYRLSTEKLKLVYRNDEVFIYKFYSDGQYTAIN